MTCVVIRTGTSLATVVGRIVEDSVKSKLHRSALAEKEIQDTTSQGLGSLSGSSEKKTSGDQGQQQAPAPTPSKTVAADSDDEELKTGEVTVDSIIAKLNAIRSGKSFREDAVKQSMEEYVQSLQVAERTALLAFLKGIAQIVTGEVAGQQAVDPADPDPSVKMQKDGTGDAGSGGKPSGGEKRTIKPNVITHSGGGKQKKPSSEDTSAPAPVPITPKRK